MKYYFVLIFGLLLFNCNEKVAKAIDANSIIDKSIQVAGGKKVDSSVIEFTFRDIRYKAKRNKGVFLLTRMMAKGNDSIVDLLSNEGFKRYINNTLIEVPDSMTTKYSASVNSVHYFSVLPYGLDGKAVNKTYLDSVEIKGQLYHKIKVTFSQDGGGEDFEDVFIYWVNTDTSKIDYLAYSYNEDDSVGLRFREAYNERFIKGIRFVDYNNFKPKENTANLEELDQLFVENKLELLSKIELENITVN